MQHIMLVDYQ